ncbi:hypothetical protein H4219_006029 [Mycoemilia scoparia]|uniref:Uncharacterized protein n=1 Tax=Mycoemilia scoparia TaxID=417184 RepID=A0A9W7ZRA0_9FUNG|nr:hypothetical protein H4219_006029 [Mycoemilia scoparia]
MFIHRSTMSEIPVANSTTPTAFTSSLMTISQAIKDVLNKAGTLFENPLSIQHHQPQQEQSLLPFEKNYDAFSKYPECPDFIIDYFEAFLAEVPHILAKYNCNKTTTNRLSSNLDDIWSRLSECDHLVKEEYQNQVSKYFEAGKSLVQQVKSKIDTHWIFGNGGWLPSDMLLYLWMMYKGARIVYDCFALSHQQEWLLKHNVGYEGDKAVVPCEYIGLLSEIHKLSTKVILYLGSNKVPEGYFDNTQRCRIEVSITHVDVKVYGTVDKLYAFLDKFGNSLVKQVGIN